MGNQLMTQGLIQLECDIRFSSSDCPASTLIVGLGNPILGDDGVGWRVAEEVQNQLRLYPELAADVDVECLSLGGLSLMEHMVGYARAIVIDAINLGQEPHGSIHCYTLEEFPECAGAHLTSTHDTSLQTALRLGSSMGAKIPDDITIIGIESASVYDFSEELTPPVAEAVSPAVKTVLELIKHVLSKQT